MKPPPIDAHQPPHLRVLLAEDNALMAEYGELLLARSGHQVWLAADGAQAVALHAQQRFDVILMDVEMPGMGGLEATAAIRARERASAPTSPITPIIAITAHMQEAERLACLAGGMDGFLGKPLDIAAIEHLLAEITARRAGAMG